MVRTGLSEVIGSWNTIERRVPRSARMSVGGALQEVLAAEADGAAGDHRVAGQQPHDGQRQRRFARTALADDADDLAARHADVDMAQGVHRALLGIEADRQVADVENVPVIRSAAAADRACRAGIRRGR